MPDEDPFKFAPATRENVKPIIGLYGDSNAGKTFSALLLARGIAGMVNPKPEDIAMIDTESGRGAMYADMIPGGYIRTDFKPPFKPSRYMDALAAAERLNPKAVVIDSFSHEWEGEGGVLDWAADNEDAGKKGQLVWKAPKMEHNRLVLNLMRSSAIVILCIRAKYKSRQAKVDGKNTIVKDDYLTPIQSEDFIFELTAHAEMQRSNPGTIRLTKWSVPDFALCFPKDGEEQLGIKHGELIAKWSRGDKVGAAKPAASSAPATTAAPAGDDVPSLKTRIWGRVKTHFKNQITDFEAWLEEKGHITKGEKMGTIGADKLKLICDVVEKDPTFGQLL